MNQPIARVLRLSLTEDQAEKAGLGDRWRKAWKKIEAGRRRKTESESGLQTVIERMLNYAACHNPPLSQRRLVSKAKFDWSAWMRCKSGAVNARRWLPKLRDAARRLEIL